MSYFSEVNKQGETIEIIIKDSSRRKIDYFKFNLNDKKFAQKQFQIVMDKYGISCIKPNHFDIPNGNKDKDWFWYNGGNIKW